METLIFAGITVLIITVAAFKYGKPTTNNYGEIHNHYYGQGEKEKLPELPDKNVLLLAQRVREILQAINQIKADDPEKKRDSSYR